MFRLVINAIRTCKQKANMQSCSLSGLDVKPNKWYKLGLTQPVRVFLLCAPFCAVCMIKIIEKRPVLLFKKWRQTIKKKKKRDSGKTHKSSERQPPASVSTELTSILLTTLMLIYFHIYKRAVFRGYVPISSSPFYVSAQKAARSSNDKADELNPLTVC